MAGPGGRGVKRLYWPIGCILTLAGSVLAAGAARAQEAAPPGYQSTVHARPTRDEDSQALVVPVRVLQDRGAQNLAQALMLIPEITVRQGGMGIRVDLRGAKQRSLLVLVDGVAMDEPYFGAFDLSAIPITDVVEIRIQLSPASPLEGPGGDGGIVEIFTLHAIGGRRLTAHAAGGSEPNAEAWAGGRAPLGSDRLGIRASAGAHFADPGYPILDATGKTQVATFFDRLTQEYASLRLEGLTRSGARLTGDLWYGHRAFYIPPSENTASALQDVTGENAARAVFGADLTLARYRLAFGAYGEIIQRTTDFYTDYTLKTRGTHQDLFTARVGSAAFADRYVTAGGLRATLSARLSVDGEIARIAQTMLNPVTGTSLYGELAVGAKLRWRQLRAEAAVGALLPFGNAAGTWPEAKVTLGYLPNRLLTLLLIGARKGRLPTLRELYDPTQGNARLNPEQTWHGELLVQFHPNPYVQAKLSAFVRQVDGFIRIDQTLNCGSMCKNVNLDTINIEGLETGIDLFRDRIFGGGAMYLFQDAHSKTLGSQPIPDVPNHRIDAYVNSTWKRRLGAVLRLRWVSERILQGVRLDRYATLDLYTWAKISRNFRAAIHVENLSDTQYLQLPGLRALPTTVTALIDGVWE